MTTDEIMANLRSARKEKRISQDAMAMLLGLKANSGGYVSNLENGKHTPMMATVMNFADALGYELVLRPKT